MWRGRFRGASPSKRVGRKEPCRRLARQVSDGEPSAARPHSCPRQSPTQLFITGPPTPTTTPTPPLRYIDAAFTGRRRLLDATATTFFVAREAHVRPPSPSVITTAPHSTCPSRRIIRRQHSYTSLVARLQAGYSFNVRGRALSQTPASLVQPAFSAARSSSKVCLCCAAPTHAAALGSHVTYMERAIFIAPARRRHIPDTTKHVWLSRTHDWKGIE